MKVDFSEPECSTCFCYRTSGILNTRGTEPRNVIGSSVTSMPVSSGPFQAFGYDSAATGSTSTSSPVHSSSPISFGTTIPLAHPVITSVNHEPVQSLGSTIFNDPAIVAALGSVQAPVQCTFGSGSSTISTSSASASSPLHCSSQPRFEFPSAVTSVSSAPTQALGPTAFSFGAFAGPAPPRFGSMQAPIQTSAPNTFTSFSFRPAQDFGNTASAAPSVFSNGDGFARSDIGFSPEINTSTYTVVFGTTPVSVSSLYGPTQDLSKTTPKNPFINLFPGFGVGLPEASSNLFGNANIGSGSFAAPTQSKFGSMQAPTFGSGVCAASIPSTFGSMQAPTFGSGSFDAPTPSTFGSMQAPTFGSGACAAAVPSTFGSMQAPTFGSGSFDAPTPSNFGSVQPPTFGSGACSASVPSTFGSMQAPTFGSSTFAAPTVKSVQAPTFGSCASASATSTSSVSSPVHSSLPIRSEFPSAVTSVSSAPTQALGSRAFGVGAFAGPPPPRFGSMQAPVQTSAPNTFTSFGFGPAQDFSKTASVAPSVFRNGDSFARPDIGFSPNINTSTNTVVFGTTPVSVSSLFGPTQDLSKTTPINPFSSLFTGFGVGLPESSSNLFGNSTPAFGDGSVSACVKTSSPSTLLPESPSIYGPRSIPGNFQRRRFGTKQENITGSAFSFVPASGGTTSSSSKFGQTNVAFTSYDRQFPSSPSTSSSLASGCTACGATSSSSASGYSTFNVATTPPTGATSVPRLFSCPVMFAQSPNSALQAYPMLFGTNLGAQDTTSPAIQAYPVNGFILLPFAAMNLQ